MDFMLSWIVNKSFGEIINLLRVSVGKYFAMLRSAPF
jgi:hypothetical protein